MNNLQALYCGNADERRIGVLIQGDEVLEAKFLFHEDLTKGQLEFCDAVVAAEDSMKGKRTAFFSAQDWLDQSRTIAKLEKKSHELKEKLNAKIEFAADLECQIQGLNRQESIDYEKRRVLEKELEQTKADLKEAQLMTDANAERIDELIQQRESCEERNTNLLSNIERLERERDALLSEKNHYRECCEQREKELSAVPVLKQRIKDYIKRLRREQDLAEKHYAELEDQANEIKLLKGERSALKICIFDLEREKKEANDAILKMEEALDAPSEDEIKLREKILNLQEENKELQYELDQTSSLLQASERINANRSAESSVSDAEYRRMMRSRNEAQDAYGKLKNQLEALVRSL